MFGTFESDDSKFEELLAKAGVYVIVESSFPSFLSALEGGSSSEEKSYGGTKYFLRFFKDKEKKKYSHVATCYYNSAKGILYSENGDVIVNV